MSYSKTIKHRLASFVRRNLIASPYRQNQLPLGAGPIVVAGLFGTASGIGQSARACYRALIKEGVDCLALDLSPVFNQVDMISDIPTIDSLPSGREGTIILHLNGPETQHGLYHAGLRIGRKWRVVGYWAWELLEPPVGWKGAARYLSEIWTPSEFVKNSIDPLVDIPVVVVPHYISVPPVPHPSKIPLLERNDGLTFLTIADGYSSFHRKNLHGAVEAYIAAFPNDKEHNLVIKCRNLEKYEDVYTSLQEHIAHRSDIDLVSKTLHEDDMWGLLHRSDVVLSLHRAEGFGLHLAEAMALGKVAVGTNWSGNLSFMTADNSVLVPSKLVSLRDPTGIYGEFEGALWAEASIPCASEKLLELANDHDLRKSLGNQAVQDIQRHLSPKRYIEALHTKLPNTIGSPIPAAAE